MLDLDYIDFIIIIGISMFVSSSVYAAIAVAVYNILKRFSPFYEKTQNIKKTIKIFSNLDKLDNILESAQIANSVFYELSKRAKETKKEILGEVLEDDGEERYIESCKDEIENPEKYEPEKSLIEYAENLFVNETTDDFIEKSISKDNINYESEIERSSEYLDDNSDDCPFIENENTVTVHEIEPMTVNEFKELTPEQKKQYAEQTIKEKYGNVENTPENVRQALLSLTKFCSNNEIFNNSKIMTVNKDFETGKYKFGFENQVEKLYMDKCRNDNNYGGITYNV